MDMPTAAKRTTFTKEQIVNADKNRRYRDVLNAILDGNKRYTLEEADKMLKEFLERKVN